MKLFNFFLNIINVSKVFIYFSIEIFMFKEIMKLEVFILFKGNFNFLVKEFFLILCDMYY